MGGGGRGRGIPLKKTWGVSLFLPIEFVDYYVQPYTQIFRVKLSIEKMKSSQEQSPNNEKHLVKLNYSTENNEIIFTFFERNFVFNFLKVNEKREFLNENSSMAKFYIL